MTPEYASFRPVRIALDAFPGGRAAFSVLEQAVDVVNGYRIGNRRGAADLENPRVRGVRDDQPLDIDARAVVLIFFVETLIGGERLPRARVRAAQVRQNLAVVTAPFGKRIQRGEILRDHAGNKLKIEFGRLDQIPARIGLGEGKADGGGQHGEDQRERHRDRHDVCFERMKEILFHKHPSHSLLWYLSP